MPLSSRYETYKYKPGQMYDPFRMGSAQELGKEFSWLYGGRPLSMQEMQPLMGRPGYDPRMGTIGGMPGVGQYYDIGKGIRMETTGTGPHAYGLSGLPRVPGGAGSRFAAGGAAIPGRTKDFTVEIPGIGRPEGVTFPYQEVGPTPAAMKDVGALAQLPYDLMDQYRRIADQGIYGPAGMHQIVSTGILPSMERTKRMTGEALTHARAARQQTVAQGARMLGKQLGGKFASQPGLAMKLMGDQIIAPSLAKEMEMSIDLKVNETNTLNALQGAIGDLVKANQESKAMGLAGVQDIMGFLQKRSAERWWDLTMENKFGWSPERTQAAGLLASSWMAKLGYEYNMSAMSLNARLQDWMSEQDWRRHMYEEMGGEGGWL